MAKNVLQVLNELLAPIDCKVQISLKNDALNERTYADGPVYYVSSFDSICPALLVTIDEEKIGEYDSLDDLLQDLRLQFGIRQFNQLKLNKIKF